MATKRKTDDEEGADATKIAQMPSPGHLNPNCSCQTAGLRGSQKDRRSNFSGGEVKKGGGVAGNTSLKCPPLIGRTLLYFLGTLHYRQSPRGGVFYDDMVDSVNLLRSSPGLSRGLSLPCKERNFPSKGRHRFTTAFRGIERVNGVFPARDRCETDAPED